MNGWKEYKLGEVTEPIKDTFNPDGSDNYAYIGLEHIEQESLRLNSVGISSDVTSNKFLFKSNDVLFGKLRPYFRKVVKPQFDGICSTDIWVFRAKKGFDQNYLYYFVANWDFVNTANSGEGGTRMPRADWNFLKTTAWNFPPLPEQIQIAGILSSLDDKIDLLHRQNKILEQLAETLFRQWFVEEAEEIWEKKKVKDVCTTISKGTTPTTLGKQFKESGINFIKAESLTDFGGFLPEKFAFIDEDTDKLLKRSRIQKGDILITIAGTIGRVAYVTDEVLPANTNQAIGFMRADKEIITPHFIYCLFKTAEVRNDFEGRVVHAVQPNLSLGEIGDIEFKMPPKEILNNGMKELENLFNKKEKNTNQIRILTQLRDTLLPKLISGDVRVNN